MITQIQVRAYPTGHPADTTTMYWIECSLCGVLELVAHDQINPICLHHLGTHGCGEAQPLKENR